MYSIAIVIGFRNRDLNRVQWCLQALQQQSLQSFELIFVDYGSSAEVSAQVQTLLSNYAFANYVFTDTRNCFWNRSHALNTGIQLANAPIILVSDIDLILHHLFLEKVAALSFQSSFYTFGCFYLPENFAINLANIHQQGIHYLQDYVGLCAFTRESVEQIRGFDEFFMVWGVEDDDFYSRLQQEGWERKHLPANDFGVFHQWHPTQRPDFPSFWYLTMVNYWHAKSTSPNLSEVTNWGQVVTNRLLPDLQAQIQPNQTIVFEGNILYRYNQLSHCLLGTVSTQPYTLCIQAHYSDTTASAPSLFARWRYSSAKQKEVNGQPHLPQKDMEMIQYYIGCNRQRILDYRVWLTPQQLTVYMMIGSSLPAESC